MTAHTLAVRADTPAGPEAKPMKGRSVKHDMSTRAIATAWTREQVKERAAVNTAELTDIAVDHFSSDAKFVKAFMQEMFRPMMREIVVSVMKSTRGASNIVALGDEVMTKDEAKQRANKMVNRWTSWLEHVGEQHIRVFDMTKTDLKIAANERRRRGSVEYELAELWEALAERLEGNERVGERFSAHEIERVRASIAERKAA